MLKHSRGGVRNLVAAQASFPGLHVSTLRSQAPPASLETQRWQSRVSPKKKKKDISNISSVSDLFLL